MLSFRRDFAPVTRQFFAPSLYILYAADFNYLIRWVIVTYILLDISVVNSHATSAYKCELLAVTWHYLLSVRPDNGDQWFGHENGTYSLPRASGLSNHSQGSKLTLASSPEASGNRGGWVEFLHRSSAGRVVDIPIYFVNYMCLGMNQTTEISLEWQLKALPITKITL